jgi:hypothetical protein
MVENKHPLVFIARSSELEPRGPSQTEGGRTIQTPRSGHSERGGHRSFATALQDFERCRPRFLRVDGVFRASQAMDIRRSVFWYVLGFLSRFIQMMARPEESSGSGSQGTIAAASLSLVVRPSDRRTWRPCHIRNTISTRTSRCRKE